MPSQMNSKKIVKICMIIALIVDILIVVHVPKTTLSVGLGLGLGALFLGIWMGTTEWFNALMTDLTSLRRGL